MSGKIQPNVPDEKGKYCALFILHCSSELSGLTKAATNPLNECYNFKHFQPLIPSFEGFNFKHFQLMLF